MKVEGKQEFLIPSPSRTDIVYYTVGVALNIACTLWGIVWLTTQWETVELSWHIVIIAILVSLFFADFFSGLLHWMFDTWFAEDTPFLKHIVWIVREHHTHPQHIFRYNFYYGVRLVSWVSLAHTMPIIGFVTLVQDSETGLGYCMVLISVLVSALTLFMFEFHKLGHRRSKSGLVKALQKAHILLSVHHHGQHHRGNHDVRYCIINGWANWVLDSIRFWRGLECVIHQLTGAIPRSDDHNRRCFNV